MSEILKSIAAQLSLKIGANITIIPDHIYYPGAKKRLRRYRYRIHIERDGFTFTTGSFPANSADMALAMIIDWINMGFVKLEKAS